LAAGGVADRVVEGARGGGAGGEDLAGRDAYLADVYGAVARGARVRVDVAGAEDGDGDRVGPGGDGGEAGGVTGANESLVRPAGQLQVNAIWGSVVSPDEARLRSDQVGNSDNQAWGMGMQMDYQNNSGLPHYPGCDVGTTAAWTAYFCVGDDRLCPYNCGTTSGGTQSLQYDYAIYVR
jgi:hypothetical protein